MCGRKERWGVKEKERFGLTRRQEEGYGQQRAGRAGQGWSGSRLPTPNGVDLADSIADSAAEAGQPGCGLLHLGHGALEPGLKAEQDTRPLTLQPHVIHQRT